MQRLRAPQKHVRLLFVPQSLTWGFTTVIENEILIRVTIFLTIFAVVATLESLWPRRTRQQQRSRRWFTNGSIVVIDSICLRLLALALPLLAIGAAIDAERTQTGVFHTVNWPVWLEILLAMLVLDFVIWAQHLLTHKIPFLWRLHRVHHADIDVDVSTAIRFHPIEIALSMLIKIGTVYLLGAPALAVILFEIILNGTALFNHANLRIPQRLDAVLRVFLVTPDMHRVHHSTRRDEHDSNYGFSLSLWDRIFGTYIAQPAMDHEDMQTGLEWRDERTSQLTWSLLLPFK